MKIFIINLVSEAVRRQSITSQCQKLGLDYQVIEAVDGSRLSDSDMAEKVRAYPECHLTRGEIGCALSHQKIYQTIIDNNLPYALILEDDAICHDSLPALLDDIAAIDRPGRQSVYLLTPPYQYIENRAISINGTKRFFKAARIDLALGYVLNQAAAKKLLEINQPILYEADRWDLFYHHGWLKVYCAVPHVIDCGDPDKTTSSLEPERSLNREARGRFLKKIRKSQPNYQIKRLFRALLVRRLEKIKKYQAT